VLSSTSQIQVEITEILLAKSGGLNLSRVGITQMMIPNRLDWMVRKCLNLRLFPDSENNNEPWKKNPGKKLNVVGNAPTHHPLK
jgi:D-tyrosyl-tRNA(Tyr) deacylase